MNIDIIKFDKYSFKFEDIDIIYPTYLKSNRTKEYYNFKKSVSQSNHSRNYQLSHRSVQSYLFDKLLEIDYFKEKCNIEIIKEYPLINTNLNNDPDRSYYLLDYFIPSKSLCIELDSDYHTIEKDKLKDNFLNSLDIKVLRINDFNFNTKDKLNEILDFIRLNEDNKFNVNYSYLISEYRSHLDSLKPKFKINEFESVIDSEMKVNIDYMYNQLRSKGITPKKAEQIIKLSIYDGNVFNAIINDAKYICRISLNDIFKILPMSRKEVDSYKWLSNWLFKYGINLNIINLRLNYQHL